MINYIKTHNISAECFKEIKERLWNDDKYMKPVEIDQWIMFGLYTNRIIRLFTYIKRGFQ